VYSYQHPICHTPKGPGCTLETFEQSFVHYFDSIDPVRAGAWSLESQFGQAGIKKKHRHEDTKGHESMKKRLAEAFRVFVFLWLSLEFLATKDTNSTTEWLTRDKALGSGRGERALPDFLWHSNTKNRGPAEANGGISGRAPTQLLGQRQSLMKIL